MRIPKKENSGLFHTAANAKLHFYELSMTGNKNEAGIIDLWLHGISGKRYTANWLYLEGHVEFSEVLSWQ